MLTPEMDILIKEAAGKYGTSESSVIEKALNKYLREDDTAKLPHFFDYAGSIECEHPSLSVKYKELTSKRKK